MFLLHRNVYGCGWSSVGTWNGNSTELGNVYLFTENEDYSCRYMMTKMAGREKKLAPMWKTLMKHVDLDEPTWFPDHVHLGSTEPTCMQIERDHYRPVQGNVRITTSCWKKLPGWEKPTCSKLRWERLRTGEQKDRAVIQSLKSLLGWSHFKKEELESDWEFSKVCSQNCLEMLELATNW